MTITFIDDRTGKRQTFNDFHKLEKFASYVIVTNTKNKSIRINMNEFTKIELYKW
jgi:hypothetical protein